MRGLGDRGKGNIGIILIGISQGEALVRRIPAFHYGLFFGCGFENIMHNLKIFKLYKLTHKNSPAFREKRRPGL